MGTLEVIADRYGLDLSKPSPIEIPIGRFKDLPRLYRALGFKEGAEVGVFQGEYAKWALRGVPGLKLHGIDSWEPYGGYNDFEDKSITDSYAMAKENVKGFNCKLIKGWSVDVSAQFDANSLDFVFIDGNHDYAHVVADLAAWSPKVRPGGIVCGHDFDDYSHNRRWREMQVIPAVEGWMKAYKINPWFVLTKNRNRTWLYVK